jgi:hypothetical protein
MEPLRGDVMSKTLAALTAAASLAAATVVTTSTANAQWGGGWYVGRPITDMLPPSRPMATGRLRSMVTEAVPAVPAYGYAVVAVPTMPTVAAVLTVPAYGYGAAVAAPAYGYGYASAGYWPYQNLYSYAPGYYRRWYWQ